MTDLLKFVVNPSLLEIMKTPVSDINITPYFSFDFTRGGCKLHLTIYNDKDGQVNISYGNFHSIILRDYCKTVQDFEKMITMLDDLLQRFPYLYKEDK